MKKRNVYAVTVAFCLFSAVFGSGTLAAGGTRHLVGIGEGGTSVAEPETTVGDTEKSTEAATEKLNGWRQRRKPPHELPESSVD